MRKTVSLSILSNMTLALTAHSMDAPLIDFDNTANTKLTQKFQLLLEANPNTLEVWDGESIIDFVNYTPKQKRTLRDGIILAVHSIENRGESDKTNGILGINLAVLKSLPMCQLQQTPKPTFLQIIALPATGVLCLTMGYLLAKSGY